MFAQYLQYAVTLIVMGYIFFDWIRLGYRTWLVQQERPGLLQLNWSLGEISGIGEEEQKPMGYLEQQSVKKTEAVER